MSWRLRFAANNVQGVQCASVMPSGRVNIERSVSPRKPVSSRSKALTKVSLRSRSSAHTLRRRYLISSASLAVCLGEARESTCCNSSSASSLLSLDGQQVDDHRHRLYPAELGTTCELTQLSRRDRSSFTPLQVSGHFYSFVFAVLTMYLVGVFQNF